MSKLVFTSARILLGLMFAVFGLNGFLQFLPMPPLPEGATVFMTGMMAAPYFMIVLKGSEIACGVLLLINKKVPLALLILAPICLQIFLFHAFLTPGISNVIMPSVLIVLGLLVALEHKEKFRNVLC
ncbi:MAG: DoxX family membrane protein [Proteobacteria bacterium]|nr:DoxX family membrane protein [Pseudomonadota bacterium]